MSHDESRRATGFRRGTHGGHIRRYSRIRFQTKRRCTRKVYNLSAALVAARSLVLRSIASRMTFATTLHPSMASACVGSNTSTEHLLSDCVKTTLSTLTSFAT